MVVRIKQVSEWLRITHPDNFIINSKKEIL